MWLPDFRGEVLATEADGPKRRLSPKKAILLEEEVEGVARTVGGFGFFEFDVLFDPLGEDVVQGGDAELFSSKFIVVVVLRCLIDVL